jgi:hypothetical protein
MSRKTIKKNETSKPRKSMTVTMNRVLLNKLNQKRAENKKKLLASIPRKILRSDDYDLISYYARSRGLSTGKVMGAKNEFEKAARAKRASAGKKR